MSSYEERGRGRLLRSLAGVAVPGLTSLTIAAYVALLAALLPLLRVISPGAWCAGALLVSAAVLGAGHLARRSRLPALGVALIELGVWVVAVTVVFFHSTALLAVIPTPATFRAIPPMLRTAVDEIIVGSAPLDASTSLAFCLVACTGILALIVDHVVITARMPLLAAVALVAVSLVPAIAVPSVFDVAGFATLAAALLFLFRTETRTRGSGTRPPAAGGGPGTDSGTPASPARGSAIAVGIGAVSVIVAIVAAPLLPTPEPPTDATIGGAASINGSLDLGSDLRRTNDLQVLTYTTDAPDLPYLRAVTLSSFNGKVWLPDSYGTTPVFRAGDLDDIDVAPGIDVERYTTAITIDSLSTQYLPVPYPAVSVRGLPSGWSFMDTNRTFVSTLNRTAQGQTYEVTTDVPKPTLEQIRAASAQLGHGGRFDSSLPADTPAVIGDTARRITAGSDTDYDALIALQDWFRGPDFTYSLTAPVRDGFDGTGAAAVADFLKIKKGYCIHFASAFALMARSLGMASRIVVGYLPGSLQQNDSDGGTVYAVTSQQLHAWPEVYFDGIGWVSFDPTKSVGTATSFSSGVTDSTGDGAAVAPSPSASEGTAARLPTDTPVDRRPSDSHVSAEAPASALVPWGFGGAGVLAALAVPAVLGTARRRRQEAAARDGDAGAAWLGVRETAIDLGIAVPASESARAFGTRIARHHGAPPAETGFLVGAIERASYARDGENWYGQDGQLAHAASAVRVGLMQSVGGGRRMRALLFPRSLVVRPGSVYAAGRTTAGVEQR